jgi:hypothetical protein
MEIAMAISNSQSFGVGNGRQIQFHFIFTCPGCFQFIHTLRFRNQEIERGPDRTHDRGLDIDLEHEDLLVMPC